MKKIFYIILAVVLIFAAVEIFLFKKSENNQQVIIDEPKAYGIVKSPLNFSGRAKGFWFFEATAPAYVKNKSGDVIGQGQARAEGEWMTADYVKFSGTIEFKKPAEQEGFFVIAKDNPSGLPENNASIEIPVKFK